MSVYLDLTWDQLAALYREAAAVASYSDDVRIRIGVENNRRAYQAVEATVFDDANDTSDTMTVGPAGRVRGLPAGRPA